MRRLKSRITVDVASVQTSPEIFMHAVVDAELKTQEQTYMEKIVPTLSADRHIAWATSSAL